MSLVVDARNLPSSSSATPHMTNGSAKDRGGPPVTAPPERRTGARARVAIPVRCRYASVLDFVETQSANISESGMFIETDAPAVVGSKIEFSFILGDGFTLLEGLAEVTRAIRTGPVNGMGVRFLDLDEQNREMIARIVAVNNDEGRNSTVNFDFSRPATVAAMPVVTTNDEATGGPLPSSAQPLAVPVATLSPSPSASPSPPAPPPTVPTAPVRPLTFEGRSLRLMLGAATAAYFTQNPLLNIRSGGFFIPAEEEVPLGTLFQVEVVDGRGQIILAGKGKVVAKQDVRVGIRWTDADKDGLARLRAEVEKLGTGK